MTDDEERKLRALIRAHSRHVNWFLARHERDPMTREELLADVFELAYRHLGELATLSEAQTRSWLLRTASFLTANEARRGARRRQLVERLAVEPLPFIASPEDDYSVSGDREQRTAAVREAFNQLSDDHRAVLARHAVGQTGPAIAAELGLTTVATRSRLMRARVAFARAYQPTDTGAAATDPRDAAG